MRIRFNLSKKLKKMKVLENLIVSEFTEMNDREMKMTLGGSGGSGYDNGGSGNPYAHCEHKCVHLNRPGVRTGLVPGVHCQTAWTECRHRGAALGFGDLWGADCDLASGCGGW